MLGAALLTPAWVFAQAVPNTAPKDSTDTTTKPIPVETVKNDQPAEPTDDEMFVLSPFEVSATTESDSYQVQDTLAGTRIRTKLKDLGAAISVVNSKFMSDISATNAQSLLQYTTNTEVGGIRGNFGGMGDGSTISENARLMSPDTTTRVRGLSAADNTRNYFATSIPWDSFNIDRVDMSRGANSMLFGTGSPAGIINQSVNEAMYTNQYKIVNRTGQYGSQRNVLDVNYVPLDKQLAIRVVGLDNNEKYQQEGTFNHTRRVYGALRFDPKALKTPDSQFTLKINNEYGSGKSRNPRVLPPVDRITPWFNDMNKLTVNPFIAHQTNGVAGGKTSTNFNPYINSTMGRLFWSNMVHFFPNANSSDSSVMENWNYNQALPYAIGRPNPADHSQPTFTSWPITGNIPGGTSFSAPVGISSYSQYAVDAGLPGAQFGNYKDRLLSDSSIFNFYEQTLDGPNTHQWQRWNGFNAEASQTFLENRLGWNYAFYAETYINGGQNYLTDQSYAISVDINTVLPDGTPNPNVGRPFVSSDGVYGNNESKTLRNSTRATLFGELRSSDFTSNKLLQSIFGHHTITAVASRDVTELTTMSWARWNATQDWMNIVGPASSLNGGSRNVDTVSYIGGDLRGSSLASGLNLGGLTAFQMPGKSANVRYFDSHWKYSLNPTDPTFIDPNAPFTLPIDIAPYGTLPGSVDLLGNQSQNPANYVGWTNANIRIMNADQGDKNLLYFNTSKRRTLVKSQGLTWQGNMFEGSLIPAFGWRRDTVTVAANTPKAIDASGLVDPLNYNSGQVKLRNDEGTRTWSLVYHMPKFIKRAFPKGMDLSLHYAKGTNFIANEIRRDFVGGTIPNPTGETKETGFTISAFDGKLTFKANWYETKMKDATLTGAVFTKAYELYLLPTWAAAHAAQSYAGLNNLQINGVDTPPWFWDWANGDAVAGVSYGQQPRPPEAAAADAAELAAIKAFADNTMPQSFYDAYGVPVSVAAMQAGDWTHAITQPGNWINGQNGGGGLQSSTGGTIGGISPTATVDTVSKGFELELYAQPIKNWNITVNASKNTSTSQNLNKTLIALISQQKTLWDSAAGNLRQWSRGGTKFRDVFYQDIYGPYMTLMAQEGRQVTELRPWRVNTISNYSFDTGFMKGIFVGAGYRWEQAPVLGYRLNPVTELIDVNQPIKGTSDNSIDLWVGYTRKLTHNVNWTIQLNVHNVGQKARLIPISVQPDGTAAQYRIANGQLWEVTNTFKF